MPQIYIAQIPPPLVILALVAGDASPASQATGTTGGFSFGLQMKETASKLRRPRLAGQAGKDRRGVHPLPRQPWRHFIQHGQTPTTFDHTIIARYPHRRRGLRSTKPGAAQSGAHHLPRHSHIVTTAPTIAPRYNISGVGSRPRITTM